MCNQTHIIKLDCKGRNNQQESTRKFLSKVTVGRFVKVDLHELQEKTSLAASLHQGNLQRTIGRFAMNQSQTEPQSAYCIRFQAKSKRSKMINPKMIRILWFNKFQAFFEIQSTLPISTLFYKHTFPISTLCYRSQT